MEAREKAESKEERSAKERIIHENKKERSEDVPEECALETWKKGSKRTEKRKAGRREFE